MTVRNVGIVFSPTLNIPAPVFALLLQNYEAVFGFAPEEYELPSPVDNDSQRRPSLPSDRPSLNQDRMPSDQLQRPSTSGSSPHRQRFMESQTSRNTPTPPPMTMQQVAAMNATQQMRSSPTPPPQRSYEPQFPALQDMSVGGQGQPSKRPAYESGSVVPQGYDAGGLAPYEQGYSSKNHRRESAIFAAGNASLSNQASKSRLREEARF